MAKINTTLTNLTDVLVLRIQERIRSFEIGDPNLKEALLRIGLLIQNQAKLNIRSQRLIDTGRLFNSIRHELSQRGNTISMDVGSFGVPYAAVHEFGFNKTVGIRGHTRTNAQGTAFAVRGHTRRMNIPKRPYLVPAIKKNQSKIQDILRDALRGGLK